MSCSNTKKNKRALAVGVILDRGQSIATLDKKKEYCNAPLIFFRGELSRGSCFLVFDSTDMV